MFWKKLRVRVFADPRKATATVRFLRVLVEQITTQRGGGSFLRLPACLQACL